MKNDKVQAYDEIKRAMYLYGKALRLMGQSIERFQSACNKSGWDDMLVFDMKSSLCDCGKYLGSLVEYEFMCRQEINGKTDKDGNIINSEDSIDAM